MLHFPQLMVEALEPALYILPLKFLKAIAAQPSRVSLGYLNPAELSAPED